MAQLICDTLPRDVRIEWYGDADHRSYQVAFGGVEALGWKAERTAADGALEIYDRLAAGTLDKTTQTITLAWYQELVKWQRIIRDVEIEGGMLDIEGLRRLGEVG